MTKYTASWFAQADEDLAAARILREQGGLANPICFHAQQAAEKCLKGFLAHHEKHARKIHDLPVLLGECEKIDPSLAELGEDVSYLNVFYMNLVIQTTLLGFRKKRPARHWPPQSGLKISFQQR